MNLREQLLIEHSKSNTTLIYNWIITHPSALKNLMQIFLHEEYKMVQRAAWVLGMIGENHPELVAPFLPQMMQRCQDKGISVAVKRNVSRCLHFMQIPEACHEAAINLCFELLASPKETIAVRCWSMGVLAKLCPQYPELKSELKFIIEDALQHQQPSAGFKSKAKRVLNVLK